MDKLAVIGVIVSAGTGPRPVRKEEGTRIMIGRLWLLAYGQVRDARDKAQTSAQFLNLCCGAGYRCSR